MSVKFKNLNEYLQHHELLDERLSKAIDDYYRITDNHNPKLFSFGKVSEVVKDERGKDYCEWVSNQEWLAEKFPELRKKILLQMNKKD